MATRCQWVPGDDPLYLDYHDREWGKPTRGERELFELLVLEGFQAGLSWATILHKRDNFRRAFDGFDPELVAGYGEGEIARLLDDKGIVRHEGKILAAVANANALLDLRKGEGSFDSYIWSFVDGEPIVNDFRHSSQLPAKTPLSESMSKGLKKRGFKFVGPTTCYSFMQACGLVNDHVVDCDFRFSKG